MGRLGCFSITKDFFHLIYRPINFLPLKREFINTKFKLYTVQNPQQTHTLVAEKTQTLLDSKLDPGKTTIFVVHGFLDNEFYGTWQKRIKDEFIKHGQYNVILVDWSGGNLPPYTIAAANTRVVGAEIALMIEELQKHKKLQLGRVHLIGHSLGAHAVGYAGLRIKGIARITGMDPAEPYFQNMPPTVRLDQTDANFVDVIHTDGRSIILNGFGMNQPVGHVDFYPNNGHSQPGCPKDKLTKFITSGLLEGFRTFVSCNHERAINLLIASINYDKVTPVGYNCKTWGSFTEGDCYSCGDGSKCAILGMRAIEYARYAKNGTYTKMYMKTSGNAPYYLPQFRVEVKLSKSISFRSIAGKFQIKLIGDQNEFSITLGSLIPTLKPGGTYTYMIYPDKDIGTLKKATLRWDKKSILDIFSKPEIFIENVKIIPLNIADDKERVENTHNFCLKTNKGIKPKDIISLFDKTTC